MSSSESDDDDDPIDDQFFTSPKCYEYYRSEPDSAPKKRQTVHTGNQRIIITTSLGRYFHELMEEYEEFSNLPMTLEHWVERQEHRIFNLIEQKITRKILKVIYDDEEDGDEETEEVVVFKKPIKKNDESANDKEEDELVNDSAVEPMSKQSYYYELISIVTDFTTEETKTTKNDKEITEITTNLELYNYRLREEFKECTSWPRKMVHLIEKRHERKFRFMKRFTSFNGLRYEALQDEFEEEEEKNNDSEEDQEEEEVEEEEDKDSLADLINGVVLDAMNGNIQPGAEQETEEDDEEDEDDVDDQEMAQKHGIDPPDANEIDQVAKNDETTEIDELELNIKEENESVADVNIINDEEEVMQEDDETVIDEDFNYMNNEMNPATSNDEKVEASVIRRRSRRQNKPESSPKLYSCPQIRCTYSTYHPWRLTKHKLIHSRTKPFECTWEGCGFYSAQRDYVLCHVRTQHFCLKKCPTRKAQLAHNKQDTRDPGRWVKANVEMSRSAGGRIKCPFERCATSFNSVDSLKYHTISIHKGVRPYRCKWTGCWGYSSAQKTHVARHIRSHHFGLSQSQFFVQTKLGQLTETRNPYDYIETNRDLLRD